jgi:hypothetical protein
MIDHFVLAFGYVVLGVLATVCAIAGAWFVWDVLARPFLVATDLLLFTVVHVTRHGAWQEMTIRDEEKPYSLWTIVSSAAVAWGEWFIMARRRYSWVQTYEAIPETWHGPFRWRLK